MNKLISLAIGILLSNIVVPVAVSAKQERFIQTIQDRISVNSTVAPKARKNKKSRYLYYHFRKSIDVVNLNAKTFCSYTHYNDNTNMLFKGTIVNKSTTFINNSAIYRPEKPNYYEIKDNLKERGGGFNYDKFYEIDPNQKNDELLTNLLDCTRAGGFQRTYKKVTNPKSN
jgi:hypothetical protein